MEQLKYVVFIITLIMVICIGYTALNLLGWLLDLIGICIQNCGVNNEH